MTSENRIRTSISVAVLCLLLHTSMQKHRQVAAKVSLADNGYKGIVISISPHIKQSDVMLKRLQKYLTEASQTLFQATRNLLYFKEFIVIIPDSWKITHKTENAIDMHIESAQIVIDRANPAHGDAPYVKQYAQCGEPGLYIHLTPSYLVGKRVIDKWGRPVRKPLPDGMDTTPVFRLVKVQARKRALVLDTSGSMTGTSLKMMKQAASNYILSCVETGSSLGIVQFSSNATALSPMTKISSEKDRQKLIKALPMYANGKTSIGSGLEKGLQDRHTGHVGGTIILITDGKENKKPFLLDIQPRLQVEGVVVHSIAYGQKAEKSIVQLSKKTGGKTFFYSGRNDSTALIDSLAATMLTNGPNMLTNVPVSLITKAISLQEHKPVTGYFFIDSTIGANTSITVSYSASITITVMSPSHVIIARSTHPKLFYVDNESRVNKVLIPNYAEIGKWTFIISTNDSWCNAMVNVQSHGRSANEEVLQLKSWISWSSRNNPLGEDVKAKVFAELVRGRAPVLNADVIAIVERPQLPSIALPLHDNGVGSDIIKNDGVYAAYVLPSDLRGRGRYSVKITARGDGTKATVITGWFDGTATNVTGLYNYGIKEIISIGIEPFQRVTSSGEFSIRGSHKGSSTTEQTSDVTPPSRITDLRIATFIPSERKLTLRWSAVGDDMDRGTASRYILHWSGNFTTLLESSGKSNDTVEPAVQSALNRVLPKRGGLEETVTLNLPEHCMDKTVYLAICAVDSHGNTGELSNVVIVSEANKLAVEIAEASNQLIDYFVISIAVVAGIAIVFGIAISLKRKWRKYYTGKLFDVREEKIKRFNLFCVNHDHKCKAISYRLDGSYRFPHQNETFVEVVKT